MNAIFTKCTYKIAFSQYAPLRKLWGIQSVSSPVAFYFTGTFQNVVCVFQPRTKFYVQECKEFRLIKKINSVFYNFRRLTTTRNRCWQCNAIVTERDLVCMTCGCVQEPRQNLNYFEIFKENPHFDMDVRILTIKYRRLQNLLHPDKFATRSEREKAYSLEQSSRVNRAYNTLCHPLERGMYLLELYGKPLIEGEITMSGDFLEDIVEINETLMECRTSATIEAIRHTNNARLEVLLAELSQAFKEKNIDRAREVLTKLKYFTNIDAQIKKIEDELGISRDDT